MTMPFWLSRSTKIVASIASLALRSLYCWSPDDGAAVGQLLAEVLKQLGPNQLGDVPPQAAVGQVLARRSSAAPRAGVTTTSSRSSLEPLALRAEVGISAANSWRDDH